MKQEGARLRQERIDNALANKSEAEKKREEEMLLKVVSKMNAVQKTRETVSKAVRDRAKSNQVDHSGRLNEIKQSKEEEMKGHAKKIKQGIRLREK
jgi:hypothetical protein